MPNSSITPSIRRKSLWTEHGFDPAAVYVGDAAHVIGRLCDRDTMMGLPDKPCILEELIEDRYIFYDSGRTLHEPDPRMQGWITGVVVTPRNSGTRTFRLVFEGDDEYESCVSNPFSLLALPHLPAKDIYA